MANVIDTEQINIIAKDECELDLDVTGEFALRLEQVQGMYNTPLLDIDDYIEFQIATQNEQGKWEPEKEKRRYPEEGKQTVFLGRANLDVASFYQAYLKTIVIDKDGDKNITLACLIDVDSDLIENDLTPPTKYGFKFISQINDCSNRWKYLLGIRKLPVKAGTEPERGPLFSGTPYFFIKCIGLTCTSRYVWQQEKEYPEDDKDAGKKRAKDIYAGVQNIVSVNNNQFTLNSVFQLSGGEFQNLNGNDLHNIKFKIVDIYDKPVPINNEVLWSFTLAKVKPPPPPPGVLVKKYSKEEVAEYIDPDDPDIQSEQPGNDQPPRKDNDIPPQPPKDDMQSFDSSLKQLKLINAMFKHRTAMKAKEKEIKRRKAEIEDLQKTLEQKEKEIDTLNDTHLDLDLNINLDRDLQKALDEKQEEIDKLNAENETEAIMNIGLHEMNSAQTEPIKEIQPQPFDVNLNVLLDNQIIHRDLPKLDIETSQEKEIPDTNVLLDNQIIHRDLFSKEPILRDLPKLDIETSQEKEIPIQPSSTKEDRERINRLKIKGKQAEIEELRAQIRDKQNQLDKIKADYKQISEKYDQHIKDTQDNQKMFDDITSDVKKLLKKNREIKQAKENIQKLFSFDKEMNKEERIQKETKIVSKAAQKDPELQKLLKQIKDNQSTGISAKTLRDIKQRTGVQNSQSIYRAVIPNFSYSDFLLENREFLTKRLPELLDTLYNDMQKKILNPGRYRTFAHELSRIPEIYDLELEDYMTRAGINSKLDKVTNMYEVFFKRYPQYKENPTDKNIQFKLLPTQILNKKVELSRAYPVEYTPEKEENYEFTPEKESQVETAMNEGLPPGVHTEDEESIPTTPKQSKSSNGTVTSPVVSEPGDQVSNFSSPLPKIQLIKQDEKTQPPSKQRESKLPRLAGSNGGDVVTNPPQQQEPASSGKPLLDIKTLNND